MLKAYFTPLTWVTFGTLLFKVLFFDAVWAAATTFSGFSMAATWINAILLAWVLMLPWGIWRSRWGEIAVMLATDLWLVCNLLYSRTYLAMIPAQSYLLAGNLQDFTASVWASLRWVDLVSPLSTAFVAWIYAKNKRSDKSEKSPLKKRTVGYLSVLGGVLALSVGITLWHGGFREHRASLSNANYWATIPQAQTLAGCIIYDLIDARQPLTQEQADEVEQWIARHDARCEADTTATTEGRRNLVLVICESLESWPIEREFQGKEITPRINAALRDTSSRVVYAPKVLTQVAGGRSIDCQLLLNAGMYPPASGCYSILYPQNTYFTLTKALKERHGAKSYLLTVDKEVTWNQGIIAKAFGIDTIAARDCWVNDEKIGSRKKLGDYSFMGQIAEKMRRSEIWPEGEPAFVQIVTYSGHNPFVIPEQYRKIEFDRSGLNERFVDYLTAMNYTDAAIGRLLDYLKTRSDYPETAVVIVGDHEGLAGDRGDILQSPGAEGLVDAGRHTPFIVLNAPVAARIDREIDQVDQYTTLLRLLGLNDYKWKGMGYDALGPYAPTEEEVAEGARISDLILKNDLLDRAKSHAHE